MGFFSRLFQRDVAAKAPPIRAHVAFDGAVRVIETPASAGWAPSESERRGDDYAVQVLTYVLPMDPMPLALLAKRYVLDGRAPEAPESTDWRAVLGPLFAEVSSATTAPCQVQTMAAGIDGTEAVLDGTAAHAPVGLRVRERRAVTGQSQLIVTAMGSPDAFAAHRDEIEAWFATAAFLPG